VYTALQKWPEVSRNPEDIKNLYGKSPLGLDFEWDKTGHPTILGISDGVLHIAVPFSDGAPFFRELLSTHPQTRFVGHNLIGADLQILKTEGIEISLSQVEDSILAHWLVNMHLSKSSGKAALEEDAGEKRGRGFNNLWTMASLYTDLPHWKDCRGASCEGPCPEHDEPWYCALDAAAPVLALPTLKRTMQLRGAIPLYELHKELASVLADMQERGIKVDVPYVQQLKEEHEKHKLEIFSQLSFNPRSPQQAIEHFKTKYDLELADAQEVTVSELVDELGNQAPAELLLWLDYKQFGNGPDRWYAPQTIGSDGFMTGYVDTAGLLHPHLGMFTSSGRLMCSSPNLQNIGKRRKSIGKAYRKAIVARPGYYLVRADLSNAENRVVLHFSGYSVAREVDLHAWVRDISGLTEDMDISKALGNAREAAKSIQHANSILEGLQLKYPQELRAPKIKSEIAAGARIVYPNWTFEGRVVSFSGVNLARRAFGSASWENRKKALDISKQYFSRFPGVRAFQQRVSKQCEIEHAARPPLGYVTLSYGMPEDRMKQAQAIWQQQPVSHVTKLALLNLHRRMKRDGLMFPLLQIHDEILCEVNESVDPNTAMTWLQEDMEVNVLDGLIIPAEPSYGPSWGEQTKKS
jgi:DNA polymerase I-like protein with 3'-5' exonuclease and polymerase domains